METTWTESAEAILAEQIWSRSERDRHQRLLHQLKLELQQEQRQRQQSVVAPAVITHPAPNEVLSTTPAAESPVEPNRKEQVFRSPKKSLPPVQIL